MQTPAVQIPSTNEKGTLGILHLCRYWSINLFKRNGNIPVDSYIEEWSLDNAMLNMLGLGLEQTITFLYRENPSFDEFEKWILKLNGGKLSQEKVNRFNQIASGEIAPDQSAGSIKNVLSPDELASWNENGYLVLPAVISREDCERTIRLICDFIGINQLDPATWYNAHPARQGIMVQLFQHEWMEKNRQNAYIRSVYEELWGRKDLIVSTARAGFNPPETATWSFPGPRIHWDVSLKLPIPFGLQGILYLADTAADQGAFSFVPGFHNKIESWLQSLPPGTNPRTTDFEKLGVKPIAANAGDFIIWHHALPHGSSPNKSNKPRFVQYFNWAPPDMEFREEWV
ncbi:MAG: phytanoyl-CoA dioxygenase family protein [Chitinophagaceae bacterium]|nr:phytanoyl-CoA dioxygenase family protein [Chitinophagaceae bacterium]